jgi:mannose-6-phosphate isomerase-like protein (cupin superfamily)
LSDIFQGAIMKHLQFSTQYEFKVLTGTEQSQIATMVLQPGESTGSTDNRHVSSDQWLYVVSGKGWAVVEGVECKLTKGSILLIEKGEVHEIRASDERLETINFYAPPEYPLED